MIKYLSSLIFWSLIFVSFIDDVPAVAVLAFLMVITTEPIILYSLISMGLDFPDVVTDAIIITGVLFTRVLPELKQVQDKDHVVLTE